MTPFTTSPTTHVSSPEGASLSTSHVDQTFTIEGMSCSGCANTVLRTIGALKGVESASIDLHKSVVHVSYDSTVLDALALKKAVDGVGYTLVIPIGA